MNTRISRISLFLLVALLAGICWFPLGAVGIELSIEEQNFIEQQKTIRVHNETDWPPFNFYENGIPQGISIDVMNRVSELTGLEIEYVTGPSWEQFIAMMQSGQLDVMLNIVDLPERREFLQFSSAYVKSLTGVFVRTQEDNDIIDFSDLEGKVVAIPAGFDLEINLPKYHPEIKLLPVRDILGCIEAVNSGKADAFAEEIGVVDYIVSQRVIPTIELAFQVMEDPFVSSLTIATAKDNSILHSIIQKGLNGISGDELNKIRQKWLLTARDVYEQSMVNLTVQEKEYLHTHNSVDICVDPSWPPLDFIDEAGQHSGLSADLINRIARRLNINLNLVQTTTWEQTLQFLRDGKCMVIPLMNETRESREYMDFTQSYFDFATVIATRKDASFIGDYSELYGKKVALQAYYFLTEYVREHHPKISVVEVENTEAALKLVSEQKVFATIDGLPTIVNTIEAQALENIKIVGSVPQENSMKLGVRKGNELLLSIMEKGVASLVEREKIGLYKKWFDLEMEKQVFNRSAAVKIAVCFVLVILFLLYRYFILNRYAGKLQVLNERLHHASTVDHLTQVYNRRSIEERFGTEVKRIELTGEPLSLVIFDIDFFKSINDSFGHPVGDRVLQQLAGMVRESIRKNDHLGRWGGEEFMIVLPETDKAGAASLIENLRVKIEQYDFGLGRPVTVSFGVGEYGANENSAEFLSCVDDRLYKAKREGRNRVVYA